MSLTPLPTSSQESAPLAHIFCLTGREWSLPAELTFGENAVYLFGVFYCRLKL